MRKTNGLTQQERRQDEALDRCSLIGLDALKEAKGDHVFKFGKALQRTVRDFKAGNIDADQLAARLEEWAEDNTPGKIGNSIRQTCQDVVAIAAGEAKAITTWHSAKRSVTRLDPSNKKGESSTVTVEV